MSKTIYTMSDDKIFSDPNLMRTIKNDLARILTSKNVKLMGSEIFIPVWRILYIKKILFTLFHWIYVLIIIIFFPNFIFDVYYSYSLLYNGYVYSRISNINESFIEYVIICNKLISL